MVGTTRYEVIGRVVANAYPLDGTGHGVIHRVKKIAGQSKFYAPGVTSERNFKSIISNKV